MNTDSRVRPVCRVHLDQAAGASVLEADEPPLPPLSRLASQVDKRHSKPVSRIPANGGVHPTQVWAGPDPMSDREVLTTDPSRRDRLHQPIHGPGAFVQPP